MPTNDETMTVQVKVISTDMTQFHLQQFHLQSRRIQCSHDGCVMCAELTLTCTMAILPLHVLSGSRPIAAHPVLA